MVFKGGISASSHQRQAEAEAKSLGDVSRLIEHFYWLARACEAAPVSDTVHPVQTRYPHSYSHSRTCEAAPRSGTAHPAQTRSLRVLLSRLCGSTGK